MLLTDGSPVGGTNRDTQIGGASYAGTGCQNEGGSGRCLDDFALWVRKNGALDRDHNSSLVGTQGIYVHTIGFSSGAGAAATTLQNTASNGGGQYHPATNATQLVAAFDSIIEQTEFEKDTFVAPAVAVNSYTGLQHRNELYFALFQPTNSPRWTGNIKKYKLVGGKIVDANDADAVDTNTGYFANNALSYWTTPTDWDNSGDAVEPDGDKINWGGFSYELDSPSTRNVYTYIGSPLENTGATPTPFSLSAEALSTQNNSITTDSLGLGASTTTTEAERVEIINWARGVDSDSVPWPNNYYVGDVIHSRPSVVTYGVTIEGTANNGDPILNFDDTIYAASNLGFLHAIDADTGEELFSFIPQELLPNLETYFSDNGTFSDKVYGLDAPMAIWRNDADNNGSVVNANGVVQAGEHVFIYQGMRRGGNNLYALDVSERSNPKLLWQINGKAYDSTPSGDFRDLAQTWSVPQRSKVPWNCDVNGCTEKDVLFFGGGYDTVHDTATAPTTGDKGNAIYMVDAVTGALLWSAGKGGHHDLNLSNMENSIPANVTVGDINGDKLADFLFAVDILGNVWRIDFDKLTTNASNFAYGGKVAELGGAGAGNNSGTNFRRFYNAPDVAYFTERGKAPFLSISLASGYRSAPNNTDIDDYLFVLFDSNGFNRPVDASGDPLYDYVNGTDPIRFNDLVAAGTPNASYGWYNALGATGEKGLSRTVTFGDQILVSTFIPSTGSTCEGSEGNGRFYLLDVFSGASLLDNNLAYKDLAHGGIPPEPSIIFTPPERDPCEADSSCSGDNANLGEDAPTDLTVCIGTECIDDDLEQVIKKSFWREN